MTRSLTALTTVLLVLFFAGCGQSGPLYIPGNPSTVEVETAETDGEEDDEDNGESGARP